MLGGVLPDELANAPPAPRHAAHVWAWFVDLSQTRQGTGFGPARLSRLEIQAWEADEGITLEPWERRAIMKVDAAYLAATAKQQAKKGTPE